MVSSDLWTDTDSWFRDIFSMITRKVSDDLSIMTVLDFFRLPPVRRKKKFSKFYDKDATKHLLGFK